MDEKPPFAVARALTGDTAFWSRKASASAHAHGLQPYLKPRENARWWVHPQDAFERMTRYPLQFPNRFGRVYHRRSTSESRFATEKGLYGDRLRSRRPEGRRNEFYCRENRAQRPPTHLGSGRRMTLWARARFAASASRRPEGAVPTTTQATRGETTVVGRRADLGPAPCSKRPTDPVPSLSC